MKTSLPRALGLVLILLLLNSVPAIAGGKDASTTITNLSNPAGDTFQVSDLSSGGWITGYFYGAQNAHAFLYQNGPILDLGAFGGGISEGFAVNRYGQVAGGSYLPGFIFHGFLYSDGNLIDVGSLGGPYSSASLINDSGVVAGFSYDANFNLFAFLYVNGTMTSLGTLGGSFSTPTDMNGLGNVVGQSADTNGNTHAFLYANGAMVDLGTLGGTYSSAIGLNDAGVIVGESTLADNSNHGFVYAAGSMTDVGTLGGTYSSAFHINQSGQVVGLSTVANDASYHGFSYAGGVMTDLGTLGGNYSFPYAINNLGQVVGESSLADGSVHAFLWRQGAMVDLNSLVPADSGWVLSSAQFLNDSGRIVGQGNYNGTSQWFVLDIVSANHPPVAVAGHDQSVDCQAQVTLDGSASSDPDNDPLTFSWTSGGSVLGTNAVVSVSLPMGTNVVTLTVTDPSGASAQANVTVRVLDTTPPSGSCPSSVTASADVNCQAVVPNLVPQVVASDNCTPTSSIVITQDPPAGTVVSLGQHPVTMTVTDSSGNSANCSVLFTVVDTTPPVIVSSPAPVTVSAGANCQAAVPNVLSGVVANDACTSANQLVMSQNPAAGTLLGLGQYNVNVSVSDAAGNTASTTVALTVADTTAPTIVNAPATVTASVGNDCQAAVPNVLPNVVATDNCTPASQLVLNQNPAAGTLVPLGQQTVVVTVTDAAGNHSSANVSLQVVDTTAPNFVNVPAPVTIVAGADCQALVPNVLPNVVASDNCTPADHLGLSQNPAAGTPIGLGQHAIAVTATDAAGNNSVANVALQVVDATAPVFLNVPGPVTLSAGADCLALVPNVLANVLASDNCTPAGQLVLRQNPAAGTPVGVGQYTIAVSATDAAGNSSTATVALQVVDTTAPVILSVSGPVTVSADANCQGAVPNVLPSVVASDNCTAAQDLLVTQSPVAGTPVPRGESLITVSVTDRSGNTSTAVVPLTVADTTPPVAQSVVASPNVLSPPNHAMIPITVTVSAVDACDGAPVAQITSVTCNGPVPATDIQITGPLTVNLAASKNANGSTRIYTINVQLTDASGNSSSSQVIVTVPGNNGNGGTTGGPNRPIH